MTNTAKTILLVAVWTVVWILVWSYTDAGWTLVVGIVPWYLVIRNVETIEAAGTDKCTGTEAK